MARSLAAEGGRVSRHGGELGINGISSGGRPAKGDPQTSLLGDVLTSPHCKKKLTCYETLPKVSELDSSFGRTQAVERSGLLWLKIGTNGGRLAMRFHKMQGNSGLAEDCSLLRKACASWS